MKQDTTEKVEPKSDFQKELEHLINKCSMENGSGTPDFILAEYLIGCLKNFNYIMQRRETWYGRWDGWTWLTKNLPEGGKGENPIPEKMKQMLKDDVKYVWVICPKCGADWECTERRKTDLQNKLNGFLCIHCWEKERMN
jgi:hypothetical protein